MMALVESKVTLRSATADDIQFLARLYCDTRRREVAAWGWPKAQQEMFLRMQFDAQSQSYRAGFPGAEDQIVCLDGSPAGRMMVDRELAGMHVIDIALLEEHRNRGVGTYLLGQLIEECEGRGHALRLHVQRGNPAIRLYLRLGFIETGSDEMYVRMERSPMERP
jgi:ribosomal protein S18 acetylase RimI-like enzyme